MCVVCPQGRTATRRRLSLEVELSLAVREFGGSGGCVLFLFGITLLEVMFVRVSVYFVFCQALSKASVSTKEFFAKDLKLVKVVLDACDAVTQHDSSVLDEFKRRFADNVPSAATHSSGSRGDGGKVGTLGSAPPISATQDLCTLAAIDLIPATVYDRISVKEDYKPLREELCKMLAPIRELAGAAKRHHGALKTRKEDKKKEKTDKYGDISAPTALCHINVCVLRFWVVVTVAFLPWRVMLCGVLCVLQVPVLSLEHEGLEQIRTYPFKVLTFEMVCKLREPLVLVGSKAAFHNLESGCAEYFTNVKKQAASKRCKIGRVSDSLNSNQLEWARQAIKRVFLDNGDLKEQIIIGPDLPARLLADGAVSSAFAPQFWAAGPHSEATNFEAHCFGTIRTLNAGSRTVACVNFDLWYSYVRSNAAASQSRGSSAPSEVPQAGASASEAASGPGAGESAGPTVVSLASQNMNVTPLDARKRFRNLTSDAFLFLLFRLRVRVADRTSSVDAFRSMCASCALQVVWVSYLQFVFNTFSNHRTNAIKNKNNVFESRIKR